MKSMKPIFIVAVILLALTIVIPSLLVLPTSKKKEPSSLEDEKFMVKNEISSTTEVAVFRHQTETIESLPLEEYIIGVVASEMPADFEMEALKAQALAARTYVVQHLLRGEKDTLPDGADITDTINHQVYRNKEELKKLWGKDFEWKYNKIREAVLATEGEIITYDNFPITASFFSTSNGYTENSEEYWQNPIPYLKSVESPWDKEAPNFVSEKEFTVKEFEERLGIDLGDGSDLGTITARTTGKKVATVKIGGKTFTGREIRQLLDLRSTDFTWMRKGDKIIVTTKGYGHGVGMSQYGANGMAREGKNYREIIQHYYQNIDIDHVNSFVDKIYATK